MKLAREGLGSNLDHLRLLPHRADIGSRGRQDTLDVIPLDRDVLRVHLTTCGLLLDRWSGESPEV